MSVASLLLNPKIRVFLSAALLCLLVAASFVAHGQACAPNAQSCSTGPMGWQITEHTFGSGGTLNSCSGGQFCAKESAGDTGVGYTCSSNYYCAHAGSNTFRQPFLEVLVTKGNVDVGVLKANKTHVGTAQFEVKTYLAHGYSVVTHSPPPTSGSDSLDVNSSPSASTPGNEQFGMNLTSNTCPSEAPPITDAGGCSGTFGSGPVQLPDATFSFGDVKPNYKQAEKYMYKNDDPIAFANSSSGFTKFTISYIFNVGNTTPAGTYTMNQSLVVTSTF